MNKGFSPKQFAAYDPEVVCRFLRMEVETGKNDDAVFPPILKIKDVLYNARLFKQKSGATLSSQLTN